MYEVRIKNFSLQKILKKQETRNKKQLVWNLKQCHLFVSWKLNIGIFQRGFTLIELLLYMGIFSILLGVLMQLFFSILTTSSKSQTTSTVVQDGRFILNRLTYDLHNTSTIVTPSLGGQGSTLQLTRQDGTSGTYSLSGNNLQLVNNTTGTTDQLNSFASTISNLTFTRLGVNGAEQTITVSFTATSSGSVNNVYDTQTFSTSIGIR